jgi:sulfur carrier protein
MVSYTVQPAQVRGGTVDCRPDRRAMGQWRMGHDSIEIRLNGAPTRIGADATVAALLAQTGLGERRVAVELNGAIVPRSLHGSQPLQQGDCVEIVHALGGG